MSDTFASSLRRLGGYYDASYPPDVLNPTPPVIPATGATAGIPGTWTPPGCTPPASPAAMTGITASPATAWTTGQYVQTSTAGAAGQTHWTGTAWAAGAATVVAGGETVVYQPGNPTAEQLAAWTVAEAEEYVTTFPESRAHVLELEQAGRQRSTLIAWLQGG